jgi:hypothetical protein
VFVDVEMAKLMTEGESPPRRVSLADTLKAAMDVKPAGK